MSAALFARLSGIPVVGVTGTRGKSTVTHLIHQVLSHATETTDAEKILLGGNVRGVSNLALLEKVTDESIAVMELDSWQLQGFGESKMSPRVAVFTTFLDDHLNYYKGDRDAYFADKAQIFLHQGLGDTLVTTPEVFARAEAYASARGATFAQEVVLVDASVVPEEWVLPLPGEHNRLNVALARAALMAMGLEDEVIRAGVERFHALSGRLEPLGTYNGVEIYNDNNATTPDATIAALEALGKEKNVVLIMGGADKGLDFSALFERVASYTKHVALLAGTGTDRMQEAFPDATIHETIPSALTEALSHTVAGDILLFSPACASFGMFQNEYDRNDQFVAAVKALTT